MDTTLTECGVPQGTGEIEETTTLVTPQTPIDLNVEAKQLLDRLLTETDESKTQEITAMFNANQSKKAMVRVDKLSTLLDTITDQALTRFISRPDEISNKELFDGLKVVQDLVERGQKMANGYTEVPLIQVNQQTNELNLGGNGSNLSRESRERVKLAVLGFLNNITQTPTNLDEEETLICEDENDGGST